MVMADTKLLEMNLIFNNMCYSMQYLLTKRAPV